MSTDFERNFFPVIHAESFEQTLRNARIAFENGADGIFLINHAIDARRLCAIYDMVSRTHPGKQIGLNFLDRPPEQAFCILPISAFALWVDDAGVHANAMRPTQFAEYRLNERRRIIPHWKGLYFGGVAFKYQEKSGDPSEEAQLAAPFVDVITTSGDATGSAPSVEKMRSMKEAVPSKPLAVASGMTPENVDLFLPYVDYFLVATGISFSHTELDPARVRMFADKVHSYSHTP